MAEKKRAKKEAETEMNRNIKRIYSKSADYDVIRKFENFS